MRLMVGDFELNLAVAMMVAVGLEEGRGRGRGRGRDCGRVCESVSGPAVLHECFSTRRDADKNKSIIFW